MPSFKPKTNKKIIVNEKQSVTLDNRHNDIMKNIEEEEQTLPELKKKKKRLQKILKTKDQNKNVEEFLEITDQIKNLKTKMKTIKSKKNDYLLDNSKYVFEYFENKKEIENDSGQKNSSKLDNFFKIKSDNDEKEDKHINVVKKYLSNVDESFIDINHFLHSTSICTKCNNGELIPIDDEGIMVCNKCSIHVQYLTDSEKPSYKEPPKEVCFYAYKRINHFREILAQFQAKETTQIPEKVIDDIKNQIRKERIDLKQITNSKAKEILKKLGYNKYYEHIPFIKDIIGIKPPVMDPELENTLCNLFMDIQRPYAKFCPDDRVNFLNYYYTVYKLCELLEQRQFLPFFPMLKDREKRIEQDNIWKRICDELEWEFIPTI